MLTSGMPHHSVELSFWDNCFQSTPRSLSYAMPWKYFVYGFSNRITYTDNLSDLKNFLWYQISSIVSYSKNFSGTRFLMLLFQLGIFFLIGTWFFIQATFPTWKVFSDTKILKARSHERLNHCDSVAGRLVWIAGRWATKCSTTVNWKRVCSSLCERWQNDEILPNSSNCLFKQAIWVAATRNQLPNFEHVQSKLLGSATQSPQPAAVHSHQWLFRWHPFSDGIAAIQLLVWTGLNNRSNLENFFQHPIFDTIFPTWKLFSVIELFMLLSD